VKSQAKYSRPARRSLHVLHATNFLMLLVTGLLFQFPEWRATLLGGYGMLLQDLHRWGGVIFGAAPILAIALVGSALWRDSWKRASRRNGRAVRRANLWAAIVGCIGFTVTGAVLWWGPRGMPRLVDASLWLHQVLTYTALAILVAHLVWIRRLIWAKVRTGLGFGLPRTGEPKAAAFVRETTGGETC